MNARQRRAAERVIPPVAVAPKAMLTPALIQSEAEQARAKARAAPKGPAGPAWRIPAAMLAVVWVTLFVLTIVLGPLSIAAPFSWVIVGVLHAPYVMIVGFLAFGLMERIGFYFYGRKPAEPGKLPKAAPSVCIQLPMFNEHAVARRAIEAAAAVRWPKDRLTIQVLDDSTDPATRSMVRGLCADVQKKTGVTCDWIHRTDRTGYKAGALEAGRRQTNAEFIAIFDADFVPPADYLERIIPHFYDRGATLDRGLALVQAQWGHLNDDQSFLTRAQAMWVDDHHTLQQSWRSAALKFVNFTGTAGVWRAVAIEDAGGWRSASLVEDCELSVRALFEGYRTKFVKEIVVPAELPETFAAYRLQQKRWTQGWAQLQRLHLGALFFSHRASFLRKIYLGYYMCISWQWPLWAIWLTIFPFLIAHNLWLGAFAGPLANLVYLAPPLVFALFAGLVATLETKRTYARAGQNPDDTIMQRLARIFPYLVVNAGMLPHHLCAFLDGLFGPMHAEFERTPKTAVTVAYDASEGEKAAQPAPQSPSSRGKIRAGYVTAELALFLTQIAWVALFVGQGHVTAALGAGWLIACIAGIRIAPLLARTFNPSKPQN